MIRGGRALGVLFLSFPFAEQLLALASMLMRSVMASRPVHHLVAVGEAVFSTVQVRKRRFRGVKSLFPDHTATLRCRQDSKSMFQAGQSEKEREREKERTGRLGPKLWGDRGSWTSLLG